MTLVYSTVHGNSANFTGAGGGIFNSSLLNITNATIAANSSGTGSGVNNAGSGTVNVRNTIIGNNVAANSAPDFSGTMTSQGYNLIENASGATISGTLVGNVNGVDAGLLPLRNNGGFTQTQALRLTSRALDKGGTVTGLTADQRGLLSPVNFPSIPNAPGGNGSDIGAYERQLADVMPATQFDFDGDEKAGISIFRPSVGEWWYSRSSDGGNYAAQFGNSADKLVPGDFTGDGKTDIAIWRPSTGEWFILRSEDGSFYSYPFGANGDIPAVGDFDGDGKADSAVFRPSDTTWYIRRSSDGGFTIQQFGAAGDAPTVADYDGDGKFDATVFRPSQSTWYVQRSTAGTLIQDFGINGDKPVPNAFVY
ncbi:MAG: FG-GAP-like repeat-containing protein [Pyrinomonadaceae bacterium]